MKVQIIIMTSLILIFSSVGMSFADSHPVITLNGNSTQTIQLGEGYTELDATTDDGSAITIDTSEFVDAIGTYSIYYDSEDNNTNQTDTVIRTVNVVSESIFMAGFDGWEYFGPGQYLLKHNVKGEFVKINGDSIRNKPYQHGMEQTFNVSSDDPFHISFDFRAKSTTSDPKITKFVYLNTTNANFMILSNGTELYSENIFNGRVLDSGWLNYVSGDLSSYLNGTEQVTVKIFLVDTWKKHWGQANHYDNVVISSFVE